MIDLLRHTTGLTYGFQMRATSLGYRRGRSSPSTRMRPGRQPRKVRGLAKIIFPGFSPGRPGASQLATDVLELSGGRDLGQPFDEFLHAHPRAAGRTRRALPRAGIQAHRLASAVVGASGTLARRRRAVTPAAAQGAV